MEVSSMNVLRRYFTLLSVLLLMRLVTACSDGSSDPSGTDRASADPTACTDDDSGEIDDDEDDDDGGDDEDEPGDVDCEDDDD
jgi:hypothetical protein